MDIREVNIGEYWPLIVRGTEEFGQIAVAENDEFNKLAACIYEVLNSSFIVEGNEYGVGRWEKMLGLTATPDMTLEDRKAAVLTRLSVKLPYTVRVLKQMLTGLLGEDNFRFAIDNDTQVLTIHLPMDITDSQLVSVEDMLSRVLPINLVINKFWMNGLPWEYTPLDYLESTGTQYIDTGFQSTASTRIELDMQQVGWGKSEGQLMWAVGGTYCPYPFVFGFLQTRYNAQQGYFVINDAGGYITGSATSFISDEDKVARGMLSNDSERFIWNGKIIPTANLATHKSTESNNNMLLFGARNTSNSLIINKGMRVWSYKHLHEGQLKQHLIPVRDEHGDACMYDLVNGVAKYSFGEKFIYPTNEPVATTYSLRKPRTYAKITEHGVRRLYHVPKGCELSIEEYALANGFKILVETPRPEEGYWTPVWHDREDCIELEWVETEPLVEEEVIENE